MKLKAVNGVSYHNETSDEMIKLLERIRSHGWRVRFHWGDTETGLDWGDEYNVTGTIGLSTGTYKVPLLIHSKRSLGGGSILTHCIVRIQWTTKVDREKYGDIYKHPKYHVKL